MAGMVDRARIGEQIGRGSDREFAPVRQNERRPIEQLSFWSRRSALVEFEVMSDILKMIRQSEHDERQYQRGIWHSDRFGASSY